MLESQGFLFLCCQGRQFFLDYNAMNRVVVEHKGSIKGNVFLASHSRGTGKGLTVIKNIVCNNFLKF